MAMESLSLVSVAVTALCASFVFISFYKKIHNDKKTPPGTKPLLKAGGALPIIGHLHHFSGKELAHKTLGNLADKYGPAFTIRFGSQTNLVISTMEMAREIFTTLDRVLSDRPQIAAARILSYNSTMLGLSPYGSYWRQMRKIATLELLSHKRIDLLTDMRTVEMRTSMKELYDLTEKKRSLGEPVDVKQWFDDVMLNTSIQLVGGKRFVAAGGESDYRVHQRKVMKELFYYFGVFNLSDAIPSLAWMDLQGHEKVMKRIAKELDELMEEWLQEHKERRKMKKGDQDFMDVLLTSLEASGVPQEEAYTITKSNCLNMILAGSDALMVTLTWALSLLLNNPSTLKKAQEEIDSVVGKDRRVTEPDTNNLPYIQSVIKETLRLYPAAPLIALHCASEDCTLAPDNYHIPKGTRLMVNLWKIHRDERTWPQATEFKPDRFLTTHKDIDTKGYNFEYLPFGSGRRSCPGTALALRMGHFTLATLLHCFDITKSSDAPIDMTESPGLTNLKATPLQVYLTPRLRPEIYSA